MGILGNLKKAYYYAKKNGLKNACYVSSERVLHPYYKDYTYEPISKEEEERQKTREWKRKILFSIAVPAYRTNEQYLKEMIESVSGQTYPYWELIIADVEGKYWTQELIKEYADDRIRYIILEENRGISLNTNVAIKAAKGDYVGLLDHDDLLTKDALYEMAAKLEEEYENGKELVLLYSDEDKCDEETKHYYEPHYKTGLNVDLILSNNYICHFMVAKKKMFWKLLLRWEYDGAQDYDFALRCLYRTWDNPELICHVPKVLYHWRCHSASTAVNPQSKMYAYEAGKRAVQDFINQMGWKGEVKHGEHLGFYEIDYEPDIFANRKDVGVIGGRVLKKNKSTGVIISQEGERLYKGMHYKYTGYMNRVVLPREVAAVDLRNMQITSELEDIYQKVVGVPYNKEIHEFFGKDGNKLTEEETERLSVCFCEEAKNAGYKVIYFPSLKDVVIK